MNDDQVDKHRASLALIDDMGSRFDRVISNLRENVFSPQSEKTLQIRFSIGETAKLVKRSTAAIRDAENSGRLEKPETKNGRRTGYSLEQVNAMREEFGTRPWRDDSDEPIVLAITSHKGGVGKSTITTSMSQYLSIKGYRVCVIDCDPQASTTSLFGVNPDLDLDPATDTLYPFLSGEVGHLKDAVRTTYWDRLDLIAANLGLFDAEYELAAEMGSGIASAEILERLLAGVDSIKDNYDIVLIDAPPALGMISLSILRAANALLIPVKPNIIDFSSTAHFFKMLASSLKSLEAHGVTASYKFMKVVVNAVDESKSAHMEITAMMKAVCETSMLNTVMKNSAEIDNASARLMSVYELSGPITSRKTHNRCKTYMNAMNSEVEKLCELTWPSRRKALRDEALI